MSVVAQPKEGLISYRQTILDDNTEGYDKCVRNREYILLTDTTWRDNHQYLLSTWMRTKELTNIANSINLSLRASFSLNIWGGANFDITMHFLH